MLSKSAKGLTTADITEVEAKLNFKLPDELKAFYLKHNGGVPDKSYFYREDPYWGYIQIKVFYSMKYSLESFTTSTLESRYADLVGRKIIPVSYVPFGIDHGNNLFTINVDNNDIVLIYMDLGEINEKSMSFVTNGFNNFINCLEEQGDDDEDV